MVPLSDRTRHELTTVRDTVESIWVAIVVALMLMAFVIQAFVIPTGSMAPELMGEHWDLICPACGYEYALSGPSLTPQQEQEARFPRSIRYLPEGASCPNCHKPYGESQQFLCGGDRVLVLKYLYRFVPPRPFDVVVFRNPQNNHENYIKRLIGLPGETIEIVHGDVFVSAKPEPQAPRSIRRKPAVAQRAMWQVVFDNDYPPDSDYRRGVPSPQWVASGGDVWQTDAYGRRYVYAGGPAAGELTFQAESDAFSPHYAYNGGAREQAINPATDVCTDLRLSVEFMPASAQATVALTLSSFDDRFRGEVAADGTVRLLYQRQDWPAERWDPWGQVALPALKLGRGYEVALENVDLSVKLLVDGAVALEVTDGYPKDYQALKDLVSRAQQTPIPTPQVGIAARGGGSELRHIRLMRDVYYTAQELANVRHPGAMTGPLADFARPRPAGASGLEGRSAGWGTTDHPVTLAKHDDNPDLDEFFVLGDNSPQSLDSRAWVWAAPTLRLYGDDGRPLYQLGTVPRYNLIGKAFFVYWPAGFRPPGLAGLPLLPNFGKMRFVR